MLICQQPFYAQLGGGIFNESYEILTIEDGIRLIPDACRRVILKPSIDSDSGKGVMVFERCGNVWKSINSADVLDENFLKFRYVNNFVLQEVVEQHPYMAQFCKTSFNTLRMATYRSVKDDRVHVIGAVLRIGKDGNFVDNAHGGGRSIAVDMSSGKLGDHVFDQYGTKFSTWNGVDFSDNNFILPNWDEIYKFAKHVGECVIHHRLVSLDIGIDKDGKPCLIETNIAGFAQWIFPLAGNTPFGEYTDEIIEYCAAHKPSRIRLTIH